MRTLALLPLALMALFNLAFGAMQLWANLGRFGTGQTVVSIPDFTVFWAAGAMALEGRAAEAWDWQAIADVEAAATGLTVEAWHPFFHPPHFLALVTPFAAVPLAPALLLWAASTAGLYLWVAWRILPGSATVLAALAAAPTVLVMSGGQSGFLMAAMLGLACLGVAEGRDARVGAGLALLSMKPQLAIGAGLVLAGAGRWIAVSASAAVFAGLTALSLAAFGPDAWGAFIAAAEERAGSLAALAEEDPRWRLYASPLAAFRQAGLPFAAAMAGHLAVAGAGVAAAVWLWRRAGTSAWDKAAALAYATALVSPRLFAYDLHLLLIGALCQMRARREADGPVWEPWLLGLALLANFQSWLGIYAVNFMLAPGLLAGLLVAARSRRGLIRS